MRIYHPSILTIVLVGSLWLQLSKAQEVFCFEAVAIALTYLEQLTANCPEFRASCSSGTACTKANNCFGGKTLKTATCIDGCVYSLGPYQVHQTTLGSYSKAYVGFGTDPIPLIVASFANYFVGGANGTVSYSFEANIYALSVIIFPVRGDTCDFSWNGNKCFCEQRYCDSNQQTYNNFVDCTAYPGGSKIDMCFVPELTTETPLMEILFWLPYGICLDASASPPVDTPAVIPISTPIQSPVGTEPSVGQPSSPIQSPVGTVPSVGQPSNPMNTPANPPTTTNSISLCFTGDTHVQFQNGTLVSLYYVQIGDMILVDSLSNKYEAVYGFGHKEPDAIAIFVQIEFGPSSLKISESHMLLVASSDGRRNFHMIPASMVQVGNILQVHGHGDVPVHSISMIQGKGLYAPLTYSGKVVVNNVQASNYISVQNQMELSVGGAIRVPFLHYHTLTHVFLFPVRVIVPMLHDDVSWLPGFLLQLIDIAQYVFTLPICMLLPIVVVALSIMSFMSIVESLVLAASDNPVSLAIAMVMILSAAAYSVSHPLEVRVCKKKTV